MNSLEEVVYNSVLHFAEAVRTQSPSAFGIRCHALPTEEELDACVRACRRVVERLAPAPVRVFIGSSSAGSEQAPGVVVLANDAAAAAATEARNTYQGARPFIIYLNSLSTPGESGLDVLVEASASDLARGFAFRANLPLLRQVAESRSRRVVARLEDAGVYLLSQYSQASAAPHSEAYAMPLLGLLPKKGQMPSGSIAADEFDKLQGKKPENRLKEAKDRLKALSSEERALAGTKLLHYLISAETDPVASVVRLCDAAIKLAKGSATDTKSLCGLTVELSRLLRRGSAGVEALLKSKKDEDDVEADDGLLAPKSPLDLLEEGGLLAVDGQLVAEPTEEDAPPSFALVTPQGKISLRGETPEGLLEQLLKVEGLDSYIHEGCAALVEGEGAKELLTSKRSSPTADVSWQNFLPQSGLSLAQSNAVGEFLNARKKLWEAALGSVIEEEPVEDKVASSDGDGESDAPELDAARLLFLLERGSLLVARRCPSECKTYTESYEALISAVFPQAAAGQHPPVPHDALGTWLTNLDLAFCAGARHVDAARMLPLHPLRFARALAALAYGAEPPPFPPLLAVNFMHQEWLEPTETPFVYAYSRNAVPSEQGIALAAREGISAAWHLLRRTKLLSALRIAFVGGGAIDAALEALCERALELFEGDSSVKDGVHLEVWWALPQDKANKAGLSGRLGFVLGPLASDCAAMPRGEGVSLALPDAIVDAGSVPPCHLVVRSVETPYEALAFVPRGQAAMPLSYWPGSSGNIAYVEVSQNDTLVRYDQLLSALGISQRRRGLHPSYPQSGKPSSLVEARVARGGWPIQPQSGVDDLLSYAETRGHVVAVLSEKALVDARLMERLRQISSLTDPPSLAELRRAALGLFSCRSFLGRALEEGFDSRNLRGQLGLLRAFMLALGQSEVPALPLSLDSPEGVSWATAVIPEGASRRRTDLLIIEAKPGAEAPGEVTRVRVVELKARAAAPSEQELPSLASQALQTRACVLASFDSQADSRHRLAFQKLAWMEAGRQHLASKWEPALRSLEARLEAGDAPALSVECWLILDEPWPGEEEFSLDLPLLDTAGQPVSETGQVVFRVIAPLTPLVESPASPSKPTPSGETAAITGEPQASSTPSDQAGGGEPSAQAPAAHDGSGDLPLDAPAPPAIGTPPVDQANNVLVSSVPAQAEEREFIAQQAAALRHILKGQGIPVQELDEDKAQIGPSVIRYRVRLRAGAKLAVLRSRAEDIGRELSSHNTPFIDNIAGEPYVSVDLERPRRQIMPLLPAIDTLKNRQAPQLLVAVGVSPSGERVELDVADLPHLLVAGSTMSGKTVFLHSLLLSLVARSRPEDLEVLIIDPKATDFVLYNELPHLRGGRVITEPEEAVEQMGALTEDELRERTAILQQARLSNLPEYNAANPNQRLKPIVVVIDEYADLVSVLSKKKRQEFEQKINRLAQRARSVGIHLVLATQRPTADIVTGLLKANMPCRVSFRLPQRVDSQTILDQTGAENLFGKGDMLLLQNDRLRRLQGYYVSPADITAFLAVTRGKV